MPTTTTARLTENKRRYRARQKEYVASIEQRLAEAREHGIQATKEVQVAAQQVMRENVRLRELLALAGYSREAVDAWVKSDATSTDSPVSSRPRAKACAAGETVQGRQLRRESNVEISRSSTIDAAGTQPAAITALVPEHQGCEAADASSLPPVPARSETVPMKPRCIQGKSCSSAGRSAEPITTATKSRPPCRLRSRLAEDPSTDVTQIAAEPTEESSSACDQSIRGGTECAKAYKMMISYATSNDNTDAIAEALESGCTPDGRGGCSVKNEVMWHLLDRMCG